MSGITGIAFITMFAGSAAIGVGRQILERRRARRELRDKAPLSANSREGNVLRVTGIVRVADSILTAPLSARECVVVRSRVRSGQGIMARAQRPYETIAMVPFIIDRGATQGTVRIEGEHVLLDVAPLKLKRGDIAIDRRQNFLARHGISHREAGRALFDETIVEAGMRVSVAGLMMKDLADEPVVDERGFRDDAIATTLRIAGNAEHPIVIGDPID
jgi:hypothetical protein